MRKSFASIVLSLSLLNVGGAWGAEGLFSDVSLDLTPPAPSTDQNSQTPREGQAPQQLPPSAPADQLGLALLVAGYQPKEVSKDVVAITMTVEEMTIPVLVSTETASNQIRLTMLLSSLADVRQLPTASLLKLLGSNRTLQPAFFAYNEAQQRIELQVSLPASSTSDTRLREELDNLAEIAKKTEKTWNIGQMITSPVAQTESDSPAEQPKSSDNEPEIIIAPVTAKKAPSQTQAGAPTPPPATAAPQATAKTNPLVGKWSATLSNEDAFALLLKSDGSFVLVHVKNSKTTQTTGKTTLAGNLLTLTSTDGTKLAGTVTMKSATEFNFRPQSSTGKSKALVFKKAS
jgi:uncharacterized protein (TIGR03066 family)